MSWSGNNNNRKRNRDRRRPTNNNNNNWGKRRNKNSESEWGGSGWGDYGNNPNWNKPKNQRNNWNQFDDHENDYSNQKFEEKPEKINSKNVEPSSNLKRRFHRKQMEEYDQGDYSNEDGGNWNDNWNNMGNNWNDRGNNWNGRGNNWNARGNNWNARGNNRNGRGNNRNSWNDRGNNWDNGGNNWDDRGNNWDNGGNNWDDWGNNWDDRGNNWNDRGNNWDNEGNNWDNGGNNWDEGDDGSYEQGFNQRRNKRRKVSEKTETFEDYTQEGMSFNDSSLNKPKKDFDNGFMQVYDSTMGRGLQFGEVQPNEIEEVEIKKETAIVSEMAEQKDPSLFGVSVIQSRVIYGKYRDIERALYMKHKNIAVPRDVQRNARNTVIHVEQLLKKISEIVAMDPAGEKEESLFTKEKLKAEKEKIKGGKSHENKESQNVEPTQPPNPDYYLLDADESPQTVPETTSGNNQETSEEPKKTEVEKVNPVQVLLGVIRCGQFECRLMLAGRYHSDFVVVCKDMPTKSLLRRVHRLMLLVLNYDKQLKTKRIIPHLHEEDEVIVIKKRDENECGFKLTIRFMSPVCSDTDLKPTEDALTLSKCLQASRSIRHVRWFMTKAKDIVQLMVMRIMIDMTVYHKEWSCLSLDIIQVLVHYAQMGSDFFPDQSQNGGSENHLQKVNGVFKRCLEVLSSGILLPGGYGLADPCTKNGDLSSQLTAEQAEQVTAAAQRDLRLLACGKIRRVLSLPIDK